MGSLVRQTIAIVALAFIPALGHAIYERHRITWNEDAVAPDEITLEQANEWGESVLWIDARPDEQFAQQHIPRALSLNEDRWNELLPQTLTAWSPERRTVVYCSSQSCGLSHEV